MSAPTCEHCRGAIARRNRDGDAQYAARRFCGRACYDAVYRVPRPTATCEHCGEVFGPTRHERPGQFVKRKPRYCSQVCNGAAKSQAATHPTKTGRDCEQCGEAIVARSRGEAGRAAEQRFCSRACYLADLRADTPVKTCLVCSVKFGPARGESRKVFAGRINCSRACAAEAKRRRYFRAAPACLACGETITPGSSDTPARLARRKYCGIECREDHRARQPRAERKPRPATPRRRRKAEHPARPRPELSVFGDRKPAETWRPAGFSSAVRVGGGSS